MQGKNNIIFWKFKDIKMRKKNEKKDAGKKQYHFLKIYVFDEFRGPF